jgi:CheY-like chemotaxis protein
VFLDVQMPRLSGLEVCEAVAAEGCADAHGDLCHCL